MLQQANGHFLAYVDDMQLGSDGVTGSADADVDQIAGPLQYGFTPQATGSDRGAGPGRRGAHGITTTDFRVIEPSDHRSYGMVCKRSMGVAACAPGGSDVALSVAFPAGSQPAGSIYQSVYQFERTRLN